MGEKKLHLLKIETNRMLKVFEHEQKLHDFIVYGDKYVICGDELGDIYIWDISSIYETEKNAEKQEKSNEKNEEEDPKSSGSYIKFKAHEKRIKQMRILKFETLDLLITCSSDGFIKIWDVLFLVQNEQKISGSQDLGDKVQSVFKINSRERICCMEVNSLRLEKRMKKMKRYLKKKKKLKKQKKLEKKSKTRKFWRKKKKWKSKTQKRRSRRKRRFIRRLLFRKKTKSSARRKKPSSKNNFSK